MSRIARIRRKILERDYYLSSHAEEELANDGFERSDMENAILHGRIERTLTDDLRGTRYRIEGPASDQRRLYVLCRFRGIGDIVIITAYAKEDNL
jgi:succinate dehydrogenase flavin-adding protein (antitoxin of CptAB toxin-antitoxin module)